MSPSSQQYNTSLKNVDTAQFTKAISAHHNSFIKLVLIVGALALCFMMFNDLRNKETVLRQRMTQAQQKIEAIKDRDDSLKSLNDFKASIPKRLNENQFIDLISDYAKKNHVSIPSLAPAETQSKTLYDEVKLSFNAVADNYKSMMLFLRTLERSRVPLRINTWSGREDDNGRVTFAVEISAILVHS